jgi:hypothetical protein
VIRTSLVAGTDFDVARVMGVFDATVSVAAAEPLRGRPAVEGIAPFLVRTGPTTICMEVPSNSIRTAIGSSITRPNGMMQPQALATLVIIRQIVQPACDLAHTQHISRNHVCRGRRSVASQPTPAHAALVIVG